MKTHKNILVLTILLLANNIWFEAMGFDGYVQTGDYAYFYTPQNLGTSTPQVADMIRYGNIPVNKYHGLLDFGVALEGYKDKDFDIPIALKYFSGGFMPSKRPSFVGYNWTLYCGGVITRKLNGSPDDVRGMYRTNEKDRDYLLDGLLVAIRDGKYCSNNQCNYSEYQLKSFSVDINQKGHSTPYLGGDFKYEFESDIYTFTFGNYYGSFIIGNNGMPVLLGDNGCKINISAMAVQPYSTTATPINSSIEITTPDGYIYTFGGTSNYLEYFIPNNPSDCKIMPRYITSWFLKSIKAPNNRIANFSYHSNMQMNKYSYLVYLKSESNDGYGISDKEEEKKNIEIKDKIYTPVLDNITVDNISIKFDYNENAAAFYSNESEDKSIQLNKISRYVNNTLLDEAIFTYQYKDRYFFLQSVSQKDLKHEFNYNLSQTLPDPMTTSLDHWGFWAGGYATTIPDVTAYCLDLYNQRVTNPNVCDVGLLNEIKYPTGGKTVITYEANQYTAYFTRFFDLGSAYLIFKELNKVDTTPQFCGGARVQSVKDYSIQNGTPINARTFLYKDSLNNESGVIGIEPRYKMTETMIFTTPSFLITTITNISSNSFGSNNLLSEYHVAYPYVTEVLENNSYTKYKFTSRLDVPDSYDIGVKTTYAKNPNFDNYATAEKYGTLFTNDKSLFRGRLLEETVYDTSGNKVSQTINKYNIDDSEKKYNVSLKSSPRSFGYYKIYLTPCLLVQQTITDKNNIQEQSLYQYNFHNFLSKTSQLRSDKKTQTTKYFYPFEITYGPDANVLREMTEKNIVGNYVHKVNYLDNNIISGEFRKYSPVGSNNQLFKPEEVSLLRLNNPINESQLYPSYTESFSPYILSDPHSPIDIGIHDFFITRPARVQMEMSFGEQFVDLYSSFSTYVIEIKNIYTNEIAYHWEKTALEGQIYGSSILFTNFLYADLLPGNYRFELKHYWMNGNPTDYSGISYNASVEVEITEAPQFNYYHPAIQPEIYYKYDSKGNMIESKPAGSNAATAYLWGYSYQYPIAEIKGATYSEVCVKIGNNNEQTGKNTLEAIANKAEPTSSDWTAINNLRTQLPNAMVTTYTYKPLVGMQTMTDPHGVITNYDYDPFGRLQKVTQSGKVIESYEYHYKN